MYLLQHYLARSVDQYPHKTAIISGSNSIDYQTLSEKSNRLANQLISIGFEPRNPIGILLPKSIEAVISIFGILKAGGCYIPLDSQYAPLARIQNIIQLSELRYLISNREQWQGLVSQLAKDEMTLIQDIKVILVDGLLEDANNPIPADADNGPTGVAFYDPTLPGSLTEEPPMTDDDLAYVLYTSGSTGIPKGVMLTHRNALTFVDWALSCFKPHDTDVFANVAPLHFDLSVFDIYVSLACGACLQLLPYEISSNPRLLLNWIREQEITYFYSVPSIWVSILNYTDLKPDHLPALTHILFAGEVFPPKQLKSLMQLLPRAAYYNLYGPTETNVCTYYEVQDLKEITDRPVPIGRACANTEVMVLKDDHTLAGPGEVGELLVKGSIVTKGYYKNPERTIAAFKRSPLPYHQGALFYQTGDIVRIIAPGLYQYIGRRDGMVKLAGFRIELPEVEQALLQHPSVQEAVVVPVYDQERTRVSSLAAFITTQNGAPVKVIALKEFLVQLLPKYMIPETIEIIAEMPKNANGKADRQRLAAQVKE
ncbi:MAG TPA: amino acid adenylation domain-containing protein [Bacillota bacterium]|nr:amino acid adenylation domain-containing protein [Bacillota bacterium]